MGKNAPDFTVSDGTSSIHLASYAARSSCSTSGRAGAAPCIQETPALVAAAPRPPDLAILAVSIDEDPDAYRASCTRNHVDLTTVRDPEPDRRQALPHRGWPETYIIDRKGVIRRKIVGDPDWSNPEIRDLPQEACESPARTMPGMHRPLLSFDMTTVEILFRYADRAHRTAGVCAGQCPRRLRHSPPEL